MGNVLVVKYEIDLVRKYVAVCYALTPEDVEKEYQMPEPSTEWPKLQPSDDLAAWSNKIVLVDKTKLEDIQREASSWWYIGKDDEIGTTKHISTQRHEDATSVIVPTSLAASKFTEPSAVLLEYIGSKFPTQLKKRLQELDEKYFDKSEKSDCLREVEPGDVVKLIASIVSAAVSGGMLLPSVIPIVVEGLSHKLSLSSTTCSERLDIVYMDPETQMMEYIRVFVDYTLKGCSWKCGCKRVDWHSKVLRIKFGSALDLLATLNEDMTFSNADTTLANAAIAEAVAEKQRNFSKDVAESFPEVRRLLQKGYAVCNVQVSAEMGVCLIL